MWLLVQHLSCVLDLRELLYRQAAFVGVEKEVEQAQTAAAGPRSSTESRLPDEEVIPREAQHEQHREHPHYLCVGTESACHPSFSI